MKIRRRKKISREIMINMIDFVLNQPTIDLGNVEFTSLQDALQASRRMIARKC